MPVFNKDGKPIQGMVHNVKQETKVHFLNGVVWRIELVFTSEEFPGQFFTHQVYPVLREDLDFDLHEHRD